MCEYNVCIPLAVDVAELAQKELDGWSSVDGL